MKNVEVGRLIVSFKKDTEWMVFKMPGGESFKILIKDHKSGNPKLGKAVIDCPKDIRITREENDSVGNH